jgi:hypothetical protein
MNMSSVPDWDDVPDWGTRRKQVGGESLNPCLRRGLRTIFFYFVVTSSTMPIIA